jgi:hypothetical protein
MKSCTQSSLPRSLLSSASDDILLGDLLTAEQGPNLMIFWVVTYVLDQQNTYFLMINLPQFKDAVFRLIYLYAKVTDWEIC